MATNDGAPARSRIFISYRRKDSDQPAARLADDLRRHFAPQQVFLDFASIDPGLDFVEAVEQGLETAAAVLVVIGTDWLNAVDKKGRRRLDLAEDWVRHEVAESLKRPGVRVFPVLVDDAEMPDADDLPKPLRPLTRRQAFPLTVRHWGNDVAELIEHLKRVPGLDRPPAAGPAPAPLLTTEKKASSNAKTAGPRSDAPGSGELPAAKTGAAGGANVGAASGKWVPGAVFRDGDDCPEMVVIPAGDLMMGSPESEPGHTEDEGPQHPVRIGYPFALGRYAVTIAEFRRFATDTSYETEAERNPDEGLYTWDDNKQAWDSAKGKSWHDPGFAQDDCHPVVGVSWNDAQAYVKWLSKKTGKPYRLPSEAEWEYAARAGSKTRYPWGDEPGSKRANFFGSGSRWSGKQTAPVGSFEPNGFGLYDTIGNVWEWAQDCWNANYKGAPADGRPWETGDCGRRVVRGGSWSSNPFKARSAIRVRLVLGNSIDSLGFRLARTL